MASLANITWSFLQPLSFIFLSSSAEIIWGKIKKKKLEETQTGLISVGMKIMHLSLI